MTEDIPQFWLYAKDLVLVCQHCDTNILQSPEDADFADLSEAVRAHVCKMEG